MNCIRKTFCLCLGLGLAAGLLLTACDKKIPPQAVTKAHVDWNQQTTLVAYQIFGSTSPKWDEPATNAINEFARLRLETLEPDEHWGEIIRTNCEAAVAAGCDDPFVHYLYLRYAMNQSNSPAVFAAAWRKTADDFEQSGYPAIRKFYASVRTAAQLKYAAGGGTNTPPTIHFYRHQAMTNLDLVVADKTTPVVEVYSACQEMLGALVQNRKQYLDCFQALEPVLQQNWPDEPLIWLLKGAANHRLALFSRGINYSGGNDPAAASAYSAEAEKAVLQAWKLDSQDARIPNEMLRIISENEDPRDQLELWFGRAMTANAANYTACTIKLRYLHPRRHGSNKELLKFGRQCVQATAYQGRVPLILSDAHQMICHSLAPAERADYWRQPEVWADIKSAYDRFFDLNPDAINWYQAYALAAYLAGQWDMFNDLLKKTGPVNYAYFGGQAAFEGMVQFATDHASQKPAN